MEEQPVQKNSRPPETDVGGRWQSLPEWKGRCNTYRIQVATRRIGYVNAILESYDGLARIQTENVRRGIMLIIVPEEWDHVFKSVVDRLTSQVEVRFIQ